MAEYNFKQTILWCKSHRVFLCISYKWMSGETVTELDFVLYKKTVRDIIYIANFD